MESSGQQNQVVEDNHASKADAGESPAEALTRQLFYLTMIGVVLYIAAVVVFGQ